MTEPARKVAELDARVSRAVDAAEGKPSREQRMIRFLADRLAFALSVFAEYEVEFELDRVVNAQPNHWFRLQQTILSDRDDERETCRKGIYYGVSMTRIRKALSAHLKGPQE